MSKTTWRDIETGQRRLPPDLARRLGRLLKASPDDVAAAHARATARQAAG